MRGTTVVLRYSLNLQHAGAACRQRAHRGTACITSHRGQPAAAFKEITAVMWERTPRARKITVQKTHFWAGLSPWTAVPSPSQFGHCFAQGTSLLSSSHKPTTRCRSTAAKGNDRKSPDEMYSWVLDKPTEISGGVDLPVGVRALITPPRPQPSNLHATMRAVPSSKACDAGSCTELITGANQVAVVY
jgi:hypothetical protein